MALPSQETLENLQKMFQGLNLDTITTVLLNNNGMVDPSVEQLLKLTEPLNDLDQSQKMTIFTMNPNSIDKELKNDPVLLEENHLKIVQNLQEEEDENIAINLQNLYISKANNEALKRLYDEGEFIDPESREESSSSSEEEEKPSKKPIKLEEFRPLPKPLHPPKKTFKEKFKSLFSRSKKKGNLMGKHDTAKLKDQEFGEIITFEQEEKKT